MTLLQDIFRIFGAKTSDIVSHDKSLIIGYSRILKPGYPRGPYFGPHRKVQYLLITVQYQFKACISPHSGNQCRTDLNP
jgi:hypothetical protein